MPLPCYLIVTGSVQGEFRGSGAPLAHENKIQVQSVDHTVEVPRNPQTGQPSGVRVHLPITLCKEIDRSSPLLWMACTRGEQLTVELEFYRVEMTGKQEKYYTVKLGEAVITSMRSWTPNCLDPNNQQMGHMEYVSFTYKKITWTYLPDGIEGEDDWNM